MDRNSSLALGYDFKSKAGITAILVALRKSEISSAEKNELRDLIFLYTSGGGDESVRISLEQKLKTKNIKPVVAEVAPAPQVLEFGTFRPVPTFKNPEVISPVSKNASPSIAETVVIHTQAPSARIENSKIEEVITVSPQPALPKVEEQIVVPSEPKPVPQLVTPVTPVSASNSISINRAPVVEVSNLAPKQQRVPELKVSAPHVDHVPAPVPRSVIPIINTKYLDRIREIKSDVNNKVGNPVNLVDIDNQVGREYMNALLEAMKRLNGGIAGDLEIAMQRLETAYVAVEKVISARSVTPEVLKPVVNIPKPEKAPEPTETKTAEVTPSVLPKMPVVPAELPEDIVIPKMTPRAVGEQSLPLVDIGAPKPVAPINLASVAETNFETPVEKPLAKTPNKPDSLIQSPYTNKPINTESETDPVDLVPSRAENRIPSLAEERKMPTFDDVPAVLPTNAKEIENPLYTSEIDAGLDQLLSDWSLFKKSGLFGNGPKGREHPLFKKISNLQIPLLLAGRFEGANQEIRQSITDYMNGWRYEQGIIYEQGETFEIYLRRVIRHIIDLQKRRVTA